MLTRIEDHVWLLNNVGIKQLGDLFKHFSNSNYNPKFGWQILGKQMSIPTNQSPS